MSNIKHTPGPWSFETEESWFRILSPNGISVAETNWNNLSNEVTQEIGAANAKLIAAAPELLEALRKMLSFYWEGYSNVDKVMKEYADKHPHSATATALAAIKRATE